MFWPIRTLSCVHISHASCSTNQIIGLCCHRYVMEQPLHSERSSGFMETQLASHATPLLERYGVCAFGVGVPLVWVCLWCGCAFGVNVPLVWVCLWCGCAFGVGVPLVWVCLWCGCALCLWCGCAFGVGVPLVWVCLWCGCAFGVGVPLCGYEENSLQCASED